MNREQGMISEAQKALAKYAKTLSEGVVPAFQAMGRYRHEFQAIAQKMSVYMQTVDELKRNNVVALVEQARLIYEQNQVFIKRFSEWARRYGEWNDRYIAMLIDLGWVPTVFYPSEMQWIVEMYEEKGAEAVRDQAEECIVRIYDERRVQKILDDWSERIEIRNRLPILKSAVQRHIAGDYWSSVPTMLPQIEGIVAQGKNHEGSLNGKKLKQYYMELTDGGGKSIEAFRSFIFAQLLLQFEHGDEIGPGLSRHGILHGGDVNYGTAANSLKAILLFDFLQEQLFESS